MSSLSKYELNYLNKKLRRNLNQLEEVIFGAEWSEHCSYKSSKKLVKLLPTKGKYIIRGRGYDSGLIDIGENYVITVHIESHNHPSAIEPYGGASTGVGGVLRDIISTGTRPIALINSLRFSPFFDDNQKNSKSRWLFSNVVRAERANRFAMAGLDGLQATRRIRALPAPASRVPVIGLSAKSDAPSQAAARAAGMDTYLAKPASPAQLADILSNL